MKLAISLCRVLPALVLTTLPASRVMADLNGLSPKDFGAIGDGRSHIVAHVLGVDGLARLQAFTSAAGTRPYAMIGVSPYGNYTALPILTPALTGATKLRFFSRLTIGGPSYAAQLPTGAIFLPVVVTGMGNLRPNMRCAGDGIAKGTTLRLLNPAASLVQLSTGIAHALGSGARLTCGFDLSHIAPGAHVTGAGQSSGTTVLLLSNMDGNETVTLSKPMTTAEVMFTAAEFWSPFTDRQITHAEMDWLGIQAALIKAKQSGGNKVMLAPGTYRLNLSLTQPSSSGDAGIAANSVDLIGSGRGNTHLTWTADPGMGSFLLTCQFRLTNGQQCRGSWADFEVIGPQDSHAAGTVNTNAMALGEGGHREILRVNASYAYAGLAITSDQTNFSSLDIRNVYYGVYFDLNDTYGNFGDHLFTEVGISHVGMAGIACSPLYCTVGDTWIRCGVFGAPYGIYKETLDGSPFLLLQEDKFQDFQMEHIGMAGVGDDRPYGTSVATGFYTIFEQFEPLWDRAGQAELPTSATTFSPHGAFFEMGQCNDCSIVKAAEAQNWIPGTDGLFDIRSSTGMTLDADVAELIRNVETSTSLVNPRFFSDNMDARNWRILGGGWEGTVCVSCRDPVGSIEVFPASGGAVPGRSTGESGEQVIGISQGLPGRSQVVATEGIARIILKEATTESNVPLRTATGGRAVQASGTNDTTSPVFAQSLQGPTPAGATILVRLRLPP